MVRGEHAPYACWPRRGGHAPVVAQVQWVGQSGVMTWESKGYSSQRVAIRLRLVMLNVGIVVIMWEGRQKGFTGSEKKQ